MIRTTLWPAAGLLLAVAAVAGQHAAAQPPATQPDSQTATTPQDATSPPAVELTGPPTVTAQPASVTAAAAVGPTTAPDADPRAATQPDAADAGILLVEMDRFGRMVVSGRTIWPDELGVLLAEHHAGGPDRRVELAITPGAASADEAALLEQCRAAGFMADRLVRRPPAVQPAGFDFPANDPRAAIELLTGQWREHRRTVAENVSAQREWLDQLDDRRQLVARQYRELSDYLVRALGQYRQALERLKDLD